VLIWGRLPWHGWNCYYAAFISCLEYWPHARFHTTFVNPPSNTLSLVASLRKIIPMQSSQDHTEGDAELPVVDSRTLVTALTQQLTLGRSTSALEAEEQGDPVFHNLIDRNVIDRALQSGNNMADAILQEITSSRSTAVFHDNEEETSVPAFLSDFNVRETLQRANSLRPQGHLSDEPQSLLLWPTHNHRFRQRGT
jgi:hypothetical protein